MHHHHTVETYAAHQRGQVLFMLLLLGAGALWFVLFVVSKMADSIAEDIGHWMLMHYYLAHFIEFAAPPAIIACLVAFKFREKVLYGLGYGCGHIVAKVKEWTKR
jgi:hypothetical protein